MLRKQGGPGELAARMVSSISDGIETITIPKRVELYALRSFGDNKPLLRRRPSFFDRVRSITRDPTLRILLVSACALLLTGVLDDPSRGWIEGVSVLMAVTVILVVTAGVDLVQESRFKELSAKIDEVTCTVIRDAHEQEISIYELVVGDLLIVKTGTILPADGVFVEAYSVKVDESVHTGESKLVRKEAYARTLETNGNPFGLAGTMIEEGSGTMLVCAVGKNSSKIRIESAVESTDRKTPLQKRLIGISDKIGQMGVILAGVAFVLLLAHTLLYACIYSQSGAETLKMVVKSIVVVVMLIVVAVPEGLSFAMKLTLSFSVLRMKDEGAVVRHLKACETMGEITDICIGKTGILTENRMMVVAGYINDKECYHDSDRSFPAPESDPFPVLTRAICLNSDSSLVYVPQKDDEHKGNRTECALLALVKRWKVDYEAMRRLYSIKARVPFSPVWKWMGSLSTVDGRSEVYVKGAVHEVLPMCEFLYTERGVVALTEEKRGEIQTKMLVRWGEDGMRSIALAYKVGLFAQDDYSREDEPVISFFTHSLVLLAVFGLRDNVRETASEAISALQAADITVRMVTGDNAETAITVAKSVGVLPEDYKRGGEEDYTVMDGGDFERLVEGLVGVNTGGKRTHWVGNRDMFQKIVAQLKVMSAATPLQKYTLITGLHQLPGRKVAVTGRDCHDAPVLRKADIGLGMNISGAQIAKEMADIVLVEDDIGSIVTAVKWGRNIYESIRKFMQFQLTVNVSVIGLSVISAAVCGQVPIGPIQLVWVNLIMDTFGALALSTDSPSAQIPPHTPLLDPSLLRTIIASVLYQLFILLTLFSLGPYFFSIYPSWSEREWSYEGFVHFTLIFHTFVLLQVVSMFNSRCTRPDQRNVFSGLFSNKLFLLIVATIVSAQLTAVFLSGEAIRCNELTATEHACCALLAIGGFGTRSVARFIPERWVGVFSIQEGGEEKSWLSRLLRKKGRVMKEEDIKLAVLASLATARKQ